MRLIVFLLLCLGACMSTGQGEQPLPEYLKLWDFQDPAGTEQKFLEVLPQAEASGDLDHELCLRTQIARTHSLRAEFDQAHALLDAIEPRLTDDTKEARVCYLLERGRSYNSAKKIDQARPLFQEAWDRAREYELHGLAVDAAHMIAIAAEGQDQEHWNLEAMKYAEASGDEKAMRWLGSLYNNLGWYYHEAGDFEKALELQEKQVAWYQARGIITGHGFTSAKWAVGRTLRSLKRYDESMVIQRELEKGEDDGFVFEEIGELLLVQGDEDGARPYFKRAHEELSKIGWFKADYAERLARIGRLGGVE